MATLKYNRNDYLPTRTNLSVSQVKAEYRRLKVIAQRRLERIGRTEFRQTGTYGYNEAMFGKGKGSVRGKSEAELRKMLYDLSSFVTDPSKTLTGLRERRDLTIAKINSKYGADIVTKDNYFEFLDFLNDKSMQPTFEGLDSGQELQLWEMRSKGLTNKAIRDNFADLMKDRENVLKALDKLPNRKRISYSELEKNLKNDRLY